MEIKVRSIDNGGWVAAYHTTYQTPAMYGEVYAKSAEGALKEALKAIEDARIDIKQ